MLRVYTASKLSKGGVWKQICAENSSLIFHARWLKHIAVGTPDTPEHAGAFWQQDEQDIRYADVVLVWGDEGQHLRGALVEAGMAIAYGVPVIVIGDHPDYGTWRYHPGVTIASDIKEALTIIASMEPSYARRSR